MTPAYLLAKVIQGARYADYPTLLRRYGRILLAGVLAVALWRGVKAFEAEVEARATAETEIGRLRRERDVLRKVSARVDTVWRRDTVRVAQTIIRYREVRSRVDSVLARDSVGVPAVVDTLVVAADSVVAACEAAQQSAVTVVSTCRADLAKADSVIALQAKEIRAIRPGKARRFLTGAGRVVTHAGAFALGAFIGARVVR